MSHFEYTDPDGDLLSIGIADRDDGLPAVSLVAEQGGGETSIHIPLDRLEEVIAGLRDMARQATGRPAHSPCMCGLPDDEDGVHPTNGDPCYITALSVGELAVVRARQTALQQLAALVQKAAHASQDDYSLATGTAGPVAEEAGA